VSLEVQPQEVRESLARILSSRQFASAERRRKLLGYLVDETLSGRGGDLKEYRIGVDVYGRDAGTYDPRVDPVIRVDIGRLRTKLAEYYAGQGRSEDLGLLLDVANRIEGHTICALGDAAAWPVQSFLKHYRHEFEYMIDHGGRSMVTDQPGAKAA